MIPGRYTLFTHIPLYHDGAGGLWTDALWKKDLVLHFGYIADLHLCCPVAPLDPGRAGLAPVTGLPSGNVHPLPFRPGYLGALRAALPRLRAIFRAARASDILHAGGAGWPWPTAYEILLLRPWLRRQRWIMVIESSVWMRPEGTPAPLRARLREGLNRRLIRACLRAADIRIFTQDDYRARLFGGHEGTLVSPAVWTDGADLLNEGALEAALARRAAATPQVLFPARLIADKGVETVLAALPLLEGKLVDRPGTEPLLTLDIIGSGPLADRCRAVEKAHEGRVRVRFLDPVPYGTPFFDLIRDYTAMVVANRTAEQPRILFDAFSQGVPAITSRTPGTVEVATEGETARFFAIDDAAGLAAALCEVTEAPDRFAAMGRAARAQVASHTHGAMHRTRAAFLETALAP